MKKFIQVVYIALFVLSVTQSQKNNDENNPYEFGFTIDGEQHRHEKKDVRGIIEGEFGFITADGIYHVTVYATDENGKFKILSMRNIRISAPLDGSPLRGEISPEADKYRKQAGLAPLPQPAAPVKQVPNPLAIPQSAPEQGLIPTTPKSEAPFKFTTQATVKPACASCGYVTTSKPVPGQPGNGFQFQNPIFQKQDQEKQQAQPAQPFGPSGILSQGPTSVLGSIPSPGTSGQIGDRFGEAENEPQEHQDKQNVGGQQQTSQYPQNNRVQYQSATGPQTTNYNSVGGPSGAQYPSGGTAGAQYPSEGTTGAQYPSGETANAQYPSGETANAQYPSGETAGAQYPTGASQDAQYPTGGQYPTGFGQQPSTNLQGPQYPGQGAQYPADQNSQYPAGENEQYPGIGGQNNIGLTDNNGGFGGIGQIGDSGPSGGSGLNEDSKPSYQQGVPQPNPLQTSGLGPSTEVSNFPPVSVEGGVIHVGGNKKQDIPIRDKFPGMQDGLPAGIEEKDIGDLLYKFHYTVGFHGHYEKGLKNGAKVGGYFVNGRDGISRVVTYVADENGYRPKVKFINLGLSSDETPKPETEKNFGLKSFEFVWYPVE